MKKKLNDIKYETKKKKCERINNVVIKIKFY